MDVDFSQNRNDNHPFSFDRMLALLGKTAPDPLQALVRIALVQMFNPFQYQVAGAEGRGSCLRLEPGRLNANTLQPGIRSLELT